VRVHLAAALGLGPVAYALLSVSLSARRNQRTHAATAHGLRIALPKVISAQPPPSGEHPGWGRNRPLCAPRVPRSGTRHRCRGLGTLRPAQSCPYAVDSPAWDSPARRRMPLTPVQGVRRRLACVVRPGPPAASRSYRAPSGAHLAHRCRSPPRHERGRSAVAVAMRSRRRLDAPHVGTSSAARHVARVRQLAVHMYALIVPAALPFVLLGTVMGLSWWEDHVLPPAEPPEAPAEAPSTPAAPTAPAQLPSNSGTLTGVADGR
jgi:hypothetical protein